MDQQVKANDTSQGSQLRLDMREIQGDNEGMGKIQNGMNRICSSKFGGDIHMIRIYIDRGYIDSCDSKQTKTEMICWRGGFCPGSDMSWLCIPLYTQEDR